MKLYLDRCKYPRVQGLALYALVGEQGVWGIAVGIGPYRLICGITRR